MERNALVLDASVIIKWFTQEKGRKEAVRIRDMFVKGEIEIAVPDLLLYELSNALRYNPNFTTEDVDKAIESIFDMNLDIIIPLPELIKYAIKLSFEKEITFYDAFYISLAKALNFKFLTADKILYNKIKDLKFVTLLSDF